MDIVNDESNPPENIEHGDDCKVDGTVVAATVVSPSGDEKGSFGATTC